MKFCHKCSTEKPNHEFSVCKGRKDGLQVKCKACQKAYAARPDVAAKRKKSHEENREERTEKSRAYYRENKERLLAQKREYYIENKEEILIKTKANYPRTNARVRERMKVDHAYRSVSLLRARISHAARTMGVLDANGKGLRAERQKIKERIEFNFKPGMSWANYGEWHIDHVKPIAAFVAQGLDVRMANLPCNLRPEWKNENMLKSSKFKGVTYRFRTQTKKADQ